MSTMTRVRVHTCVHMHFLSSPRATRHPLPACLHVRPTIAGALPVAQALAAEGGSLTSLNLSSNALMPEGVAPIMTAVASTRRLRSLNLSHNGIRDDGFECVARVVAQDSCALNKLVLSNNMATMRGLRALAAAVGGNNRLVELDVRGNDWGDEAGTELARQLRAGFNFELQKLTLAATPLPVQDVLGNTELAQYRLLAHRALGTTDMAFIVEAARWNTWLSELRCVATTGWMWRVLVRVARVAAHLSSHTLLARVTHPRTPHTPRRRRPQPEGHATDRRLRQALSGLA